MSVLVVCVPACKWLFSTGSSWKARHTSCSKINVTAEIQIVIHSAFGGKWQSQLRQLHVKVKDGAPQTAVCCWRKALAWPRPLSVWYKSFPQFSIELLVFPERDLGTILLPVEHSWKLLSIFIPRTREQLRLPLNQVFTGGLQFVCRTLSPPKTMTLFMYSDAFGFLPLFTCACASSVMHMDDTVCRKVYSWIVTSLSLRWTWSLSNWARNL